MTKKQKVYLSIAIVVAVVGLVLSFTYRPYIYQNHINDFGFADTIGSLVAVIAYCCYLWSTKEYSISIKKKHVFYVTITYAFLWEFLGFAGIYGTFDWKDVIASIISGVLSYFLMMKIETNSAMAQK